MDGHRYYYAQVTTRSFLFISSTISYFLFLTHALTYIENNYCDIARAIIASGVTINRQSNIGNTALMYGCEKNFYDMSSLLITHGADVNIANELGNEPNKIKINSLIYVSYVGITALLFACVHNNLSLVNLLVASGADINHENVHRWTPLLVATENGRYDIIQFLLSNGARPDAKTSTNRTALSIASKKGHLSIVELLLRTDGSMIDVPGRIQTTFTLSLTLSLTHLLIHSPTYLLT